MIEGLVQDGRVALLAIAVLLVEIALARRLSPAQPLLFVANAFSGLFLVAALYAALTDLPGLVVVGALSLGFVAHLASIAVGRRG